MTLSKTDTQDTLATKDRCIEALLELKAEDILVIDLTDIADFTDYFVICSGGSDTHVKALADSVLEKMREELGQKPWHREGYDTRKWILLDYVDVVVHVFQRDVREYYALERLWADAPMEQIEDDAPAEDVAGTTDDEEA